MKKVNYLGHIINENGFQKDIGHKRISTAIE